MHEEDKEGTFSHKLVTNKEGSGMIGSEVGVEKFQRNCPGISREFDGKLNVFLILSIWISFEILKSILNAHLGQRYAFVSC